MKILILQLVNTGRDYIRDYMYMYMYMCVYGDTALEKSPIEIHGVTS